MKYTRKSIKWYEWLYSVDTQWNIYIDRVPKKNKQQKPKKSKNPEFEKNTNPKKINLQSERKMKNWKNWWGYNFVWFSREWKSKYFLVHRLVADAFLYNKENKTQINHINWVKTDNRVENLEWCTSSENIKHAIKTWLIKHKKWKDSPLYWRTPKNILKWKDHPYFWKRWKEMHNARKVDQYDLDWNFIKTWDSIIDIKRHWLTKSNRLSECCKYKNQTCAGFYWRYFSEKF